MVRKTIEVGKIQHMVNCLLASPTSTADGREAACALLEAVLMASSAYEGFRYLETTEIAGNGTRRFYFVNAAVQDAYDRAEQESVK